MPRGDACADPQPREGGSEQRGTGFDGGEFHDVTLEGACGHHYGVFTPWTAVVRVRVVLASGARTACRSAAFDGSFGVHARAVALSWNAIALVYAYPSASQTVTAISVGVMCKSCRLLLTHKPFALHFESKCQDWCAYSRMSASPYPTGAKGR